MNKYIFLSLFFINSVWVFAQTCSFSPSALKICLGTTVTLTPVTSGGTVTKYEWDFGDSKTDSTQKPNYKYNTPGTYQITLKVTFSGGNTCNATPVNVQVLPLPSANLTVESTTSQCFEGNYFCFKDRSVLGSGNIVQRTILFGDGAGDLSSPISQKDFCHVYGAIGTFSPVIEVKDTFGCMSRKVISNAVTVAPDVYPKFKVIVQQQGCGFIRILFVNESYTQQADVKNYKWIFGDGDSVVNSSWDNVIHTYTGNGIFNAKLIVTNKQGCTDTFATDISNFSVPVGSFTWGISPKKVCYSNRGNINFSASAGAGVTYTWVVFQPDGQNGVPIWDSAFKMPKQIISGCGRHPITLHIKRGLCDTVLYDTIDILGPKARIELGNAKVTNKYQCAGDTMYAPPANMHFSSFCTSTAVQFLWNFGDYTAPNCTTDTRKGINVNTNCNYSKDSINVKHKYPAGIDTCYTLRLTLRDSVTGCTDYDSTKVVVGNPSSDNITAYKPWCIRKDIYFELGNTKPYCDKQEIWILPDSDCVNKVWQPLPLSPPHLWNYASTCNGTGKVTVGFVIRNGNCYDTTWYHHMIDLEDFDSRIFAREEKFCDSLRVTISLYDSIQQHLQWVEWDFGDNNIFIDTLGPNDSIIYSKSFTFYGANKYGVVVRTMSDSGCLEFDYLPFHFGFLTHLYPYKAKDSTVCEGQTVLFVDSVRYYNGIFGIYPDPYWRWAQPRPEKLYWNFDDGNGFNQSGPLQSFRFNTLGNYTIKLAAVDKDNCFDTAEYKIRVLGTQADFGISDTLFICGQIARFYDSSFVLNKFTHSGYPTVDSIVAWEWDFGDGKTPSILKNPYHDYTSFGTFQVRLRAFNTIGCYDDFIRSVRVIGPSPSFEIASDTIGCVPYIAAFRNTSSNVRYWLWDFGDSTNLSVTDTSLIQHTYTKPGIYEVKLFGVDTFLNPVTQNTYYCAANFPDTTILTQKRFFVHVLPVPQVNFTFKSPVCVGENVVFRDSSDVKYTSYRWYFTATDSLTSIAPKDSVIYSFRSSGKFGIHYAPFYLPSPGQPYCVQTKTDSIEVVDVIADFETDTVLSAPPFFYFKNTSSNASVYFWDFGDPQSGSLNTAITKDGGHSYVQDTGIYIVCLSVLNKEGCADSVCKYVEVTSNHGIFIPNVFTPQNGDNKNDVFDIPIFGHEYYTLVIYNRWGQIVFESNDDTNDWDGKELNTNIDCPDGVYFFVLSYRFKGDKSQLRTGPVTLIRAE